MVLKPLALLDVDGVINSWPPLDEPDFSPMWQHYQITISNETVKALKALFDDAHEVMWCSTWRESANDWPLPWMNEVGVTSETRLRVVTDHKDTWEPSWKMQAVRENTIVLAALREGRPVIWFEDFGWDYPDSWHPQADVIREFGITPIDTTNEHRLLMQHIEEAGMT